MWVERTLGVELIEFSFFIKEKKMLWMIPEVYVGRRELKTHPITDVLLLCTDHSWFVVEASSERLETETASNRFGSGKIGGRTPRSVLEKRCDKAMGARSQALEGSRAVGRAPRESHCHAGAETG